MAKTIILKKQSLKLSPHYFIYMKFQLSIYKEKKKRKEFISK